MGGSFQLAPAAVAVDDLTRTWRTDELLHATPVGVGQSIGHLAHPVQ
jgi:hypothetical protein